MTIRKRLAWVAGPAVVIMMALGALGPATPANAGALQWKHGVSVSRAHVFNGAGSNIDCVWAQNGVSACIRFDRSTIYVRSDRADGRFKLGQFKKQVGGATYRCQNDKTRSAGDGTWVGCNFSWVKIGCYTMKSGYGQADWYVLNFVGVDKCWH